MSIPNYDNWKLSNGQEDERVSCSCEECGREIYVGEFYYEITGHDVHEDCLDDYVKQRLAEQKVAE
jgi:hypothetical protein